MPSSDFSTEIHIEEILDKRSSMNILGNLNDYTKFQAAQSMEDAANNPSGGASEGIGMGMGFGMAQNMMQNMNQQQPNQQQPAAGNTPPPIPNQTKFFYVVNGAQQGPVSQGELSGLVSSNQVTRETMVWKEGMANWEPAGNVQELSGLFGSMPPPLP